MANRIFLDRHDNRIIYGDENNVDHIWDTEYNRQIRAAGGSDLIYGGAGNDQLLASFGNYITSGDTIYGGSGSDTIFGGSGTDTLHGGIRLQDDSSLSSIYQLSDVIENPNIFNADPYDAELESFGSSIDINGDYAIIGRGRSADEVFIFNLETGALDYTLTYSGAGAGTQFGAFHVAMTDNYIVVDSVQNGEKIFIHLTGKLKSTYLVLILMEIQVHIVLQMACVP